MLLAVLIGIISTLNPFVSTKFWYTHDFLARGRYWAPLTAPFAFQGHGIPYLLSLVNFYTNISAAETKKFHRTADLVFYLLFVVVIFLAVGPSIGSYAYLNGVGAALSYTITQDDPEGMVQYFVFQTKRKYTPWIGIVVAFVAAGLLGIGDQVVGIAAGHMFLFLTELLPLAGGPKLSTPQWIANAESKTRARIELRRRGGHRLGR